MSTTGFQQGTWKAPSTNIEIAYRLWAVPGSRNLIVIIHGFGEHGGRYIELAAALAEKGFSVVVPDLLNHGLSSGKRGDISDVPTCVSILRQFTEAHILPSVKQASYTLYGHSFGGMVAIRWAMNAPKQLNRLIVQSPLIKVGFQIPAWKEFLGLSLADVLPGFSLSMNLDTSALSHDAEVVRAYQADPLVHNKMSARCYRSIVNTRDAILAHPEQVKLPTLLLCGLSDRIISIATARMWFNQLTCNKRIVEFPDAYNELHHEQLIRQRVIDELSSWAAPA